MSVEDYLPEWESLWEIAAYNPRFFFHLAWTQGLLDDSGYQHELTIPPTSTTPWTLAEYIRYYPGQWNASAALVQPPYLRIPGLTEEQNRYLQRQTLFTHSLFDAGFMTKSDFDRIRKELATAIPQPGEVPELGLHYELLERLRDYLRVAFDASLKATWPVIVKGAWAAVDVGRKIVKELWDWFLKTAADFFVWLWEKLKPARDWLRENVPLFLDWLWGHVKAMFEQYWPPIEEAIEKGGRTVFDWTVKNLLHGGQVTPEMAPGMAAKMFGVALTAGVTAHLASVGFELIHPFKSLGFHQMTGMIAQLGSFGPVTAATLGQVHYAALRRPMMYACNKVTRSQIPDEKLLIELRSKREIDKAEFDEAMAYQGLSDKWIDVIERWQWKDPRMFELMRVADIGIEQGPPPSSEMWWFNRFGITGEKLKDWWLYRKLMRAGYEDVDLDVLVRTIHRREISFAMTYVRTAVRRNYRWGFLADKELDEWIDRLMLPKQAKTWISWAGDLDREYFYRNDLKGQYKMAYRNDLIDEDELHLSLLLLGLPMRNVREIVTTERIRKSPRVRREAAAPQRAAMSKIQIKHTQLYIEQYRKGVISRDGLLQSLMAIDIRPELAELTCELEETKLLPKPKLESVYP